MKNKIGFAVDCAPKMEETPPIQPPKNTPVKSLVEVNFPFKDAFYTYYNDRFDLKVGDIVFVEGTMEDEYGEVIKVTKKFKIKPADYKRVISVADTTVAGKMHFLEEHVVSFDPLVLPYEKIRTWFIGGEDEEPYEIVSDDLGFSLNELERMDVTKQVFDKGWDYYMSDYVMYLSVNGTQGRAIVQRHKAYEVEFDFIDGEIRNLFCNCPCGGTCKHSVAAILQLKDLLSKLNEYYPDMDHSCFAAIPKVTFMQYAVKNRQRGSFVF